MHNETVQTINSKHIIYYRNSKISMEVSYLRSKKRLKKIKKEGLKGVKADRHTHTRVHVFY